MTGETVRLKVFLGRAKLTIEQKARCASRTKLYPTCDFLQGLEKKRAAAVARKK